MNAVSAIGTARPLWPSAAPSDSESGASFSQVLGEYLQQVNRLQLDAEAKTRQLVAGEDIELHQVMLAAQKAEIALELTQTLRNKVIEAYQEIMRMQV
ncbi:MAG: flagellar hook-basal body complex protein FliE [Bacillota bacterium]|jgi:flagellar hook-basal body complex protein FliE|nr:flagellar hook-basal body complex protein FliE [Bacillota bacterium]MDK2927486.1 flagellar hook-basal body complex protein FliE [Bacillota bacterium]